MVQSNALFAQQSQARLTISQAPAAQAIAEMVSTVALMVQEILHVSAVLLLVPIASLLLHASHAPLVI